MSVYSLMSMAPCDAAVERLRTNIDDAVEMVSGACDALNALKSSSNFPTDRKNASEKVMFCMDRLSGDMASGFREVSAMILEACTIIFVNPENVCKDIEMDLLKECSEWLPSNTLHQPRYIKLHEFAAAVHTATSLDEVCQLIDPDAFCYTAPDDMSVQKILSRTVLYMHKMRDSGEMDWVTSAFTMIGELGTTMDVYIRKVLADMQECLESPELQNVAIQRITNPALDEHYLRCIDTMLGYMGRVSDFCASARKLCDIYSKLSKVMYDSQDTIMQAIGLYNESCKTTF